MTLDFPAVVALSRPWVHLSWQLLSLPADHEPPGGGATR
jgi:hypothetical protein